MKQITVALLLMSGVLLFTTSCKKKTDPKPETITQQPANNATEVHLFGSNVINQVDPQAPEIGAASGTYFGDPVNIRALLKFDLGEIPSTATIVSAKLSLYSNPTPLNGVDENPNYGSNNAFLIERINSSWQYDEVDWTNQPGTDEADAVEVPHTAETTLDVVADVKNLVARMVATGNNGFLIRLKTEESYNFRIFCSSKYNNTSKHPKLEVTYK